MSRAQPCTRMRELPNLSITPHLAVLSRETDGPPQLVRDPAKLSFRLLWEDRSGETPCTGVILHAYAGHGLGVVISQANLAVSVRLIRRRARIDFHLIRARFLISSSRLSSQKCGA